MFHYTENEGIEGKVISQANEEIYTEEMKKRKGKKFSV